MGIPEVLGGLRYSLAVETEDDSTHGLIAMTNVKVHLQAFCVSTMPRSSSDSLISDLVSDLGPFALRISSLGKEDKNCSENDEQRYCDTLECGHLDSLPQ